jgi:hypothetical protein
MYHAPISETLYVMYAFLYSVNFDSQHWLAEPSGWGKGL